MELKTQVITSSLGGQYNSFTKEWNLEYITAIGMTSLYEGYIIKIYDEQNRILWDAQAHDMSLCKLIMEDISGRMRIKYPQLDGEFISSEHKLLKGDKVIGYISISYFRFLNSLNTILITIGVVAIALSIIVGYFLAKRISSPILNTVEAAKQISDGNYEVRLKEHTNTKELDMLTDSINHLAGSLFDLERLRKQLTADVAHELRTPISILQSHIEAILEGVWEPTSDRLQSCYDETVRIGKLVGDLENLAKIENDNLKLEKIQVKLKDLMSKTIISFEENLRDKNLTARMTGPDITVSADPGRMTQVLFNLLSNAIKYSDPDADILLETQENEGFAGFIIRDQGIGIPEDELPYIFERFYRADKSRNRLTGGSGIGLTIVKSIVEAHGGYVRVESRLQEGSCFTVMFPKK
jgi:signal transduction histidine kinase